MRTDSPTPPPANSTPNSGRRDGDSWDLTTSVGATATMVAAARALASRETDALIDDPFAQPLVDAVGIDFFTRLAKGGDDPDIGGGLSDSPIRESARLLIDVISVRTRFFDDFFLAATAAGVQQAVILASGLDSRAYRLAWPAGAVVFEIDQPEVIGFKSRVLGALGAEPTAERRAVAADLRDDWPAALRVNGFDPDQPTAWIAEGLLLYLPPDAQDRLFDNVTAQSAPGSRLATEDYPGSRSAMVRRFADWSDQWEQLGLNVRLPDLLYTDGHNIVGDYLDRLGWEVNTQTRPEIFAAYGRPFRSDDAAAGLQTSLNITATRR